MTDTDFMFDGGEDSDFVLDFDATTLAEGVYPAEITSVEWLEQPAKKNPEVTSKMFVITTELKTNDEYDGQQFRHYMWMANDSDKPRPMNVQRFAAFVRACGLPTSGQMSIRQYEPVIESDSKGNTHTMLSAFKGLPIGVRITEEKSNLDPDVMQNQVKGYTTIDKATDSGDEETEW